MIDYDRKYSIVIDDIQHGKPIGEKGASWRIDLHHTFLHNTKRNRKTFPYLIDSPFNLTAIWHEYHIAHPDYKPFELSEAFLREIEKALAAFDEAVKTTEGTFEELYDSIGENLRVDFLINFLPAYDGTVEKLIKKRLYAALKYLWDKRR